MHGLVIVTGINGTGKSTVTKLINEQSQVYGSGEMEVRSASRLMRELGGSLTYQELAAMDVDERNELRQESFDLIRELAEDALVFLDAHFVFEDGETVDFTPLMDIVEEVVVVRSEPNLIHARMISDLDSSDHVGRLFLLEKGLEFVRSYQEAECQQVEAFIAKAQGEGLDISVSYIENNGGLEDLEEEVIEITREFALRFGEGEFASEGAIRATRNKEY